MSADLSARGRASNLARMRGEMFDLLVVGGGIVGAGIARDAALRGLKTALVERGDFASGTSSKTSRLVHGGLRYLRNFKIGLVRQAVRERDLLLERAPGLVTPLAFTIPAYEGRGLGKTTLRFGLWVYDFLSRDKVLPRRRWLTTGDVKRREPKLAEQGLGGGGLYHDALTNDARLVLAVIRAAADKGAIPANYAEVTGLLHEGDRVCGGSIRDRMSQDTFELRAAAVVNATGVWLDRLRSMPPGSSTLRPTKGIHIFLPRKKVGNREAVVLSAKEDGRMLFVLPWGHLTLVGTTDTDFRGDLDQVVPDGQDVAYLLDSVNDAFPEAHVGMQDIVSSYAGLRPLLGEGKAAKESDISREHEIFEDADGLLSVAGGKLTTHRAMAQEVVDRVCVRLARGKTCSTSEAALGPRAGAVDELRALGVEETFASHLASCHPIEDIRPWIGELSSEARIETDLPYLWIEISIAVENEMALTLEDVMVRRLGLFYESPDQGVTVAPAVAERMGSHLAWDAPRKDNELRAYRELVANHRRYREGHDR
jgi:glycerol-3-phosphate dehydrogenase